MNDEITTITIHTDTSAPDTSAPDSGRRRGPGRRGRRGDHGRNRRRGGHVHEHHHAEHDRGGRSGRHRARRGAVRVAVLTLLDERPMHGYELITELETRSEGRWRPSPGAIYPALEKMEAHGAVTSTEVDGKRQFSLTDRGRQMLAEIREAQGDDAELPWNQTGTGGRGELRRLMSELGGQVRQIARFGSTEQRDAATAALEETRRTLYEILARPSTTPDSDADPGADRG